MTEKLEELAARVEAATGPDREMDAEIMFDLFARPVGKHKMDSGPTGYLWPEDDASWAFGHRFPGKDRKWFTDVRHFDRETLVVERDGALVLMNELRVPNLTASLDAAMTLVPEGWDISAGLKNGEGHAYIHNGECIFTGVGCRKNPARKSEEVTAATPALALTAAALRARSAEEK